MQICMWRRVRGLEEAQYAEHAFAWSNVMNIAERLALTLHRYCERD